MFDYNNPDHREFIEAGGAGTFAGWVPEGGYMTSNTNGLPPSGSYFKDGKYLTINGKDERLIPPGYELLYAEEGYKSGDEVNEPDRMVLKRRDAPASAPAAEATPPPAAPVSTRGIEEARQRIDAFKASRAADLALPRHRTGSRPGQAVADSGYTANRFMKARNGLNELRASLEAEEIGYASRDAISRFTGKTPSLSDPKDLFKYYSDTIKNA